VVAKAPSSRKGRSVVPKTLRRRSVRRGWGGDRCVAELTTLLQRIGEFWLQGSKVDLQPLNSTVRPLGCLFGRNREIDGGVRSPSTRSFSKAREFTVIFSG
jgi:hypothetical protein